MKLSILILIVAMPFTQVSAQSVSQQFEFAKMVPEKAPVKSGNLVYDLSLSPENDEYTREVLDENAEYYFSNVFSSTMTTNNGKHEFSGVGSYSFSTNNSNDPNDMYIVSYVLDISTTKRGFTMSMHNFTVSHLGQELNLSRRIDAASGNDMIAKAIVTNMHKNNLVELRKALTTMYRNNYMDNNNTATASK